MAVLSGYKAMLRNQRSALLSTLTWLAILAATLYLAAFSKSAIAFAETRAILLLAAFVLGLAWLYREVRFTFQRSGIPALLREALPFMLSDGLVAIYTSADIVIISMLLGREMAGLYGPVSTLTAAAFIVPQSIFVVALPVISALMQGPQARLKSFVRKTWLLFTLVGGALWLGLALFAQPVVALLLGPGYAASSEVLRILSMILFFKSGSFAMVSLLIAADRQKYRLVVQAVVAAFNVILNLLVVLRFGIHGVAWVYVLSEALLLVGYLVGVRAWQKQIELR
jgi:O-antigen/teichoic acid export membrane protein